MTKMTSSYLFDLNGSFDSELYFIDIIFTIYVNFYTYIFVDYLQLLYLCLDT